MKQTQTGSYEKLCKSKEYTDLHYKKLTSERRMNPNDIPCQMKRQSSHFWRKTHWETGMNGYSGNKWTVEF